MAYNEPTVVSHFGRPQPAADLWRIREFLRRKLFSQLLEMRGDCEKHAAALRGDPREIGDALAALQRALERGLADRLS